MKTKNYIVDAMAATGLGDVWLSADGAAIALGMITPSGEPSRRSFLEDVSARPGFPKGFKIGNQTKWLKSEVMTWAAEQARLNRAT